MVFIPSKYQAGIFEWITDGSGNAVCNAIAGSGKSTTLEEGAKLIREDGIAIAFNAHIALALKQRFEGTPIQAATLHSLGRRAIARINPRIADPVKNSGKYQDIIRDIFKQRGIFQEYEIISGLRKLLDQCRNGLIDPRSTPDLLELANRFDVLIETGRRRNKDDKRTPIPMTYLPMIGEALDIGERKFVNAGIIDFTDMIYLPIRLNANFDQSFWVLGDEIQDWNACQAEIAVRLVGERFLGVGDPRQSIMAFAGADDRSFEKIKERLNAIELPLSVCYRCPSSHIVLAQAIVPTIESWEGAQSGTIVYENSMNMGKLVKPGDLILSRRTAPLISACIKLIGQGIGARVKGRDIGKQLTDLAKTVSKMDGFKPNRFGEYLNKYQTTQIDYLSQKENSETAIESLNDRCEALDAAYGKYYESGRTFSDVMADIEALFSDDKPVIMLSTIHRAKGLEAERVMIMDFDNLPMVWKHQKEYQYIQECNLKYVALTRSKNELIIFGTNPNSVSEEEPDDLKTEDESFNHDDPPDIRQEALNILASQGVEFAYDDHGLLDNLRQQGIELSADDEATLIDPRPAQEEISQTPLIVDEPPRVSPAKKRGRKRSNQCAYCKRPFTPELFS